MHVFVCMLCCCDISDSIDAIVVVKVKTYVMVRVWRLYQWEYVHYQSSNGPSVAVGCQLYYVLFLTSSCNGHGM